MWLSVVAGPPNSGTTIEPATPTGAWWMGPAKNGSLLGLQVCGLNVIVPSFKPLICVWRVAVEVDRVFCFLALGGLSGTHMTPPCLAVAGPAAAIAATHAITKQMQSRCMSIHTPLSVSHRGRL